LTYAINNSSGSETSVKRKDIGLVGSSVGSLARVADERKHVARALADPHARRGLDGVARPKSMGPAMKSVGTALILSPDPLGPIVDIPAVVLIASSYLARKNEPLTTKNVILEARRLLQDMESLA
jgi:hypothetical protein